MAFITRETAYEGNTGFVTTASLEDLPIVFPKNPDPRPQGLAWYGNVRLQDCYTNVLNGDSKYLPKVDAMLTRLTQTVNVETSAYTIDNSVIGFLPDIPAAIQNVPESMISAEPTQSDFAPITLWVNVAASSGISAEAMATKGAAICALVQKIEAIRPVILNLVVTQLGRDTNEYLVIPFPTRPLNVASLAYAMCCPGFSRHMWGWFIKVRGTPQECPWEKLFSKYGRNNSDARYHKATIGMLGGDTEHDVYVPMLFLYDPMIDDPIGWIETRLAKYLRRN